MTPDELEAHPIFEPFIRAVLEQLAAGAVEAPVNPDAEPAVAP